MVSVRWVIAGVAAVFYVASLVLPCANPFNSPSGTTYSGVEAFRVGWRAVTVWEPSDADWFVLSAAWLANPAIWVAVAAAHLDRWRIAAMAAGCALLLCASVLFQFGELVAGQPGFGHGAVQLWSCWWPVSGRSSASRPETSASPTLCARIAAGIVARVK
jgi:hypothetical protein